MSVRPLVRRAVTVSTAAAGLSVLSCGIAVAVPVPLPPVPDPGDTVATVQQTVTGAVNTVTSALPVSVPPSPGGTPQAPTTKPPTSQTPATQTPATQTPATKQVPTVVRHPSAGTPAGSAATGRRSAHPATAAAWAPVASYNFAAFRYPTATAIAATSQAPAIAPIPAAAPTTPILTTLAAHDDHQQPSTLRALLLALAAVAAAALSIEHFRQAQQRLGG